MDKKILIQIFKFTIVGGIATIIDWTIYYLLFNILKINPLLANLGAFSISVIYNYIASGGVQMKVVKANLPDGVRKKFVTKIGKKVKLVNKKYAKKKKKTESK